MRRGVLISMILAVACVSPAAAQDRLEDRVVVNTLMGPGFVRDAAVFNMRAAAGVKANDWLAVLGEWGTLTDATPSAIRTPVLGGQHLNANVMTITPSPIYYNLRPYATAGVGTFRINEGITSANDRTEFATNLGAGLRYDFNRWLGVSFDYRRFFVDFGNDVAGKNRYTFGVNVGLK
jgi:opacity protein-like surface antigen